MAWTQTRVCEHLNVSPEIADQIIGLARGRIDPFTVPATEAWRRQCYHEPDARKAETKMHAIAAVLDGFGTEAIWGDSPTQPVAEYVNQGDTYAATIVYDYARGRFLLTTWGDWVERYGERLHVR